MASLTTRRNDLHRVVKHGESHIESPSQQWNIRNFSGIRPECDTFIEDDFKPVDHMPSLSLQHLCLPQICKYRLPKRHSTRLLTWGLAVEQFGTVSRSSLLHSLSDIIVASALTWGRDSPICYWLPPPLDFENKMFDRNREIVNNLPRSTISTIRNRKLTSMFYMHSTWVGHRECKASQYVWVFTISISQQIELLCHEGLNCERASGFGAMALLLLFLMCCYYSSFVASASGVIYH